MPSICTPFGPTFSLATTTEHVRKQNGGFAMELPTKTEKKFIYVWKHLKIQGLRPQRGMANGPQLKTVPFSDQRCIHTSRPDQLLCSTPIISSSAEEHFRLSKQEEVPLISSIST